MRNAFAVFGVVVASIGIAAAAETQSSSLDPIQRAMTDMLRAPQHGDVHAEACGTMTVACDTNQSGSLGSCLGGQYYVDLYQFTGTAGQKIIVTASSTTNQYMKLIIMDSGLNLVASDYNIPSITVNYTLPSSGTYFIGVNFVSTFTIGKYNLTVSCPTSTPQLAQCFYTSTVNIGGSVTGQLTSSDAACWVSGTSYAKAYKVPVTAGDTFEVDYSASFQPYIDIKGPDTSGAFRYSTSNSLTTMYVAPQTGNVTIYAASNTTSPVTGSFTLTLVPVTQPPCGKMRAVRH